MTITNLETYVSGYKVVDSSATTVTLENGTEIDKAKCRWLSSSRGASYYHYEDDTLTADDTRLFSVYMFDPEHGWHPPVDSCMFPHAITIAKDFRDNWAGSRVALVPDGVDPDPFLEFALAVA